MRTTKTLERSRSSSMLLCELTNHDPLHDMLHDISRFGLQRLFMIVMYL